MENFKELQERLRKYTKDRDWDQFHSPKNLAMALNVEAAELLEHFQWLTESQSHHLCDNTLADVADEIADVQVYLLLLANKLGINIDNAVAQKVAKNEIKYPAEQVRGSAHKYTDYQ